MRFASACNAATVVCAATVDFRFVSADESVVTSSCSVAWWASVSGFAAVSSLSYRPRAASRRSIRLVISVFSAATAVPSPAWAGVGGGDEHPRRADTDGHERRGGTAESVRWQRLSVCVFGVLVHVGRSASTSLSALSTEPRSVVTASTFLVVSGCDPPDDTAGGALVGCPVLPALSPLSRSAPAPACGQGQRCGERQHHDGERQYSFHASPSADVPHFSNLIWPPTVAGS